MVCYSRGFVVATLKDRLLNGRISQHLLEQLYEFDCDQLSRFLRAMGELEGRGQYRNKSPRPFNGSLAGYDHYHFLRQDWAATNFAHAVGLDMNTPLEESIDMVAESIMAGRTKVEAPTSKMKKRMAGKATGDWVIYSVTSDGNYYLSISEHVDVGSIEEGELKQRLDAIASSPPLTL